MRDVTPSGRATSGKDAFRQHCVRGQLWALYKPWCTNLPLPNAVSVSSYDLHWTTRVRQHHTTICSILFIFVITGNFSVAHIFEQLNVIKPSSDHGARWEPQLNNFGNAAWNCLPNSYCTSYVFFKSFSCLTLKKTWPTTGQALNSFGLETLKTSSRKPTLGA